MWNGNEAAQFLFWEYLNFRSWVVTMAPELWCLNTFTLYPKHRFSRDLALFFDEIGQWKAKSLEAGKPFHSIHAHERCSGISSRFIKHQHSYSWRKRRGKNLTLLSFYFKIIGLDQRGDGPCWLLKLRLMGTQRIKVKEVLPWLVLWDSLCRYKRFLSYLG